MLKTLKHFIKLHGTFRDQRFKSTMSTLEECRSIWKKADTVCFDVDSTLIKDEGLDELAEFCGVGPQVREW